MRPFDSIDTLTEQVIAAAIRVHDTFGPGLLESVYRRALVIELVARDIPVEAEKSVPLLYRGQNIGDGFKLDILVNGILVVEVKAVERILPVHLAQVITYLKVTRCPAGLLLNFNTTSLRSGGLRRLDHPDRYVRNRCDLCLALCDRPLSFRQEKLSLLIS